MATPDYNQGNERREATSPRELKRASALKEKGVPKATTQDSCFSHMIRTGQSLRAQPVEVQPAERDSPGRPSPGSPGGPPAGTELTRHGGAALGCSPKRRRKKLKRLSDACFRVGRRAETLSLLRCTPPSWRLLSGEGDLASFLKIIPLFAKKKGPFTEGLSESAKPHSSRSTGTNEALGMKKKPQQHVAASTRQ